MKTTIAAMTTATVLAMATAMPATAGWNDFKKWTKTNLGGMAEGDCYKYIFTAGKKGNETCSF